MLARATLYRWWLAKLISKSNTKPQGLCSVSPTSGPFVIPVQPRSLLPFLLYVPQASYWCKGWSPAFACYTNASRQTASLLGLLDSSLFYGNSEFHPQGERRGAGVFLLHTTSGWKQSSCCKPLKLLSTAFLHIGMGTTISYFNKHYLRDRDYFN